MRTAAALALLPAAAALAALPRPALLLWTGLGVLVGVLTQLWCRAAEDLPRAQARATALRVGGATILGGWALAGATVLVGPATVPLLPVALAVLVVWRFLADRVSSAQTLGALRGDGGACEDRVRRLASGP